MSDSPFLFAPPNTGRAVGPSAPPGRAIGGRREEERNRTLFERIFAPFEAPQQFLYSLTREVGSDGFQWGDLLTAGSHAGRYFNPFSNQTRIDENEVRQILFGRDNLEEGEPQGAGRSALNLGIALLYDPLWMLAPVRAAGKAGMMSQRAMTIMEKIVNPGQLLFDGVGLAARGTTRAVGAAVRATRGADAAELMATNFAQSFISKYAGMPEEAAKAMKAFESKVNGWRELGAKIIKSSQRLKGRRGQELLGEAMELDALAFARKGMDLTADQRKAYDGFRRKLQAEGISEDLFMQVYDNFRALDDNIGTELLRLGLISGDEFAQYQGIHLRRVYKAFENPADYIDKLEALVERFPGGVRVNKQKLTEAVTQATPGIQRMAFQGASGDKMRAMSGLRRYIDPTSRKFNPSQFADDIDNLVRNSQGESMATVMRKVKKDILGMGDEALYTGAQGADDVAELLGITANYISGALFEQKGAQHFVDILRNRIHGAPYKWRTMKENLSLLESRVDMPREIREALGEVMSAAPRMAREVGELSALMEFRRMSDVLTDTVRLTGENFPELKRLREAVKAGTMSADEALAVARRNISSEITPKIFNEGVEGAIITSRGTTGASLQREAIQGAAIQLPVDERLGSLSGAWVKPAIARMVGNVVDTTPGVKSASAEMFEATANLYRQGLSTFKALKVVWDPVAQARNFIGNAILADFMGTQTFRPDLLNKTIRTMRDISKGTDNHYARLAAESGHDLFGTTFSKSELNRLGDALAGLDFGKAGQSPTNLMTRVYEGFHGAMDATAGKYGERMGRLFQFNEELFKMSVFIDQFEKLKTPLVRKGVRVTAEMEKGLATQAAALAEQALFNYGDIPYAVQFLRDSGLVPFVTFPFKAAQYTAKTLYQHPLRVLKHHRVLGEATDWLSGGPDETAREVDALPRYLRESLVTRLPFGDADGRPLYVDFSYFMPYAVVKEMSEMVQQVGGLFGFGEQDGTTSPREYGLREGYFSPPLLNLLDMIRRNEDGRGRPIVKPEYSTEQRFQSIANTLLEFILPPSFPGGSRAETIGRSLQAISRTESEPVVWMEFLAQGLRGFGPESNEAFTYPGVRAQTGAAVGASQLTQGMNWVAGLLGGEGAETLGPRGTAANVVGTILDTGIFGGATASDQSIADRQAMTNFNNQLSNVGRQIAQVRSNPNLSRDEKVKRIQRLMELRQRVLLDRGRR